MRVSSIGSNTKESGIIASLGLFVGVGLCLRASLTIFFFFVMPNSLFFNVDRKIIYSRWRFKVLSGLYGVFYYNFLPVAVALLSGMDKVF